MIKTITPSELRVGMVLENQGGRRWIVVRLEASPKGPLPVMTVAAMDRDEVSSWDTNLKPYVTFAATTERFSGDTK